MRDPIQLPSESEAKCRTTAGGGLHVELCRRRDPRGAGQTGVSCCDRSGEFHASAMFRACMVHGKRDKSARRSKWSPTSPPACPPSHFRLAVPSRIPKSSSPFLIINCPLPTPEVLPFCSLNFACCRLHRRLGHSVRPPRKFVGGWRIFL